MMAFTLMISFAYAQVDTVVVRVDSMFESKIHRKLYDKRTPVKYHLEERGNVRDIMLFLAELEELNTGQKLYGVRIDQRLNRAIFTDAPQANAEYIDQDELPSFLDKLRFIRKEVMTSDHTPNRYTEYRFYTRAGIMLECYTGVNRWRCLFHYELAGTPVQTYISNPERLNELIAGLEAILNEIQQKRRSS
jgi:hypothetical protein